MPKDAVLLMAYGAAKSLSEIPAYLADILSGRPVRPELVEEITERYKQMGGTSPLFEITESQRAGIDARLSNVTVDLGMRHSAPTIREAVARLKGHARVMALPLTPYRSKLSVGAYLKKLEEAREAEGATFEVVAPPDWNLEPSLIDAYAKTIGEAAEGLNSPVLLMTAHSLPERILGEGDPYQDQLKATAKASAEAAGFSSHLFAYQSRGGSGREAWLGPDASEVLETIAKEGHKAVVLCPFGFVSDHLETLYDDDVLYKGQAESLGLTFHRARALNDSPEFLGAVASVAKKTLS